MFDVSNIIRSYRQVVQKTRTFLLSNRCKECLVFLFFVLVSAGFWALQTLDNTYQSEFSIPLKLKNVPKEVVITSEFPSQIRVKVEDRGAVLLNYLLGHTFYPISFDFDHYKSTGTYVKIPLNELQKKIATQLNVSTRIISVRPDTLDFVYAEGVAKKIPVHLQGEVNAGLQYYVSQIRFKPDSVIAYAPTEVLDTLNLALTEPVSLHNVCDTIHTIVPLSHIKGVKFVPAFTELSVAVDMYSEKTIEVPIEGLNFPKGKVLRTFPSKVDVTFQVGLQYFTGVSESDFHVGVDYAQVMKNQTDKVQPVLISAPDYATHVRISPSSVDYLIEQQEE